MHYWKGLQRPTRRLHHPANDRRREIGERFGLRVCHAGVIGLITHWPNDFPRFRKTSANLSKSGEPGRSFRGVRGDRRHANSLLRELIEARFGFPDGTTSRAQQL